MADAAVAAPSRAGWSRGAAKARRFAPQELELPDHKTKGWEFTDLSELIDLDAFDPGAARRRRAQSARGRARVVQVDATADGGPRRRSPSPWCTLAEAPSDLDLVASGSARRRPAATPSSPATTAPGGAAPSSTSRAGAARRAPSQLAASTTPRAALDWRTLIVLEEGAEAEVWERWLAPTERAGLFNGVVELIVGAGATCATSASRALRRQLGLRHPARRGRARRVARLGRARLRLGARQGADGDQARRAGLDGAR